MIEKLFLPFIDNDEANYPINEEAISRAAITTLKCAKTSPPAALSIIITSDEVMQDYNLTYAGKDEPTDVLSFPAEDSPYATEPGEPPYLGDILIAYPIAEIQAEEAGHSIERELQTLAIHGVLHLLGYDHGDEVNHARMYRLQSQILEELEGN